MSESTRRRVKLYVLNEERQWDDRGTGHVSALISSSGGSCNSAVNDETSSPLSSTTQSESYVSLVVISESDGTTLLESRIQPDTAYQKQQETLIVWSEGENSDLALSFQEKNGCDDIWARICNVQGKDPSLDITQELVDDVDDPDDSDITSPTGAYSLLPGTNNSGLSNLFELPPCELTKLGEMLEMFSNNSTLRTQREQLANCIVNRGVFLQQLVEVFRRAEIAADMSALSQLHDLAKQLLSLNHLTLYSELFAPSILMDIIGMLEYTPNGRRHHREFLCECTSFQDICTIQDRDLIDKIHQTYRVQYIQECCLSPPSPFDDNTLNYLTTFVQQNKTIISRQLLQNDVLMRRLFFQIHDLEDVNSCSTEPVDENLNGALKPKNDLENSQTQGESGTDSLLDSMGKDIDERLEKTKIRDPCSKASIDSQQKRKNLVFFLRELCQMCNSLQGPDKDTYLHQLIQVGNVGYQHHLHQSYQQFPHHMHPNVFSSGNLDSPMLNNGSLSPNESSQIPSGGLLGVLKVLLCSSDIDVRHAALDILQILLDTHVGIVREFMFREDIDSDNNLMFNLLINQLLYDSDPEASHAMNVSLMTRALIDPEGFLPNGFNQVSEKNEFVAFLLKRVMPFLVRPLTNNTQGELIKKDDYHSAHVMFYILDILSFAIESHSHAMKNFLTQRQLFSRIIVLLRSQHTFLVLAVIRLLRRVLSLKDEFYNRSLIRCSVFPALMNCFRGTEHRYNLVNSALLELFDFVHTESIICLIQEMGNKGYLEELAVNVTYVNTFRMLLERYQMITQTQRPFIGSNNSSLLISNGSSNSSFQSPQQQIVLSQNQRLAASISNISSPLNQMTSHLPASPINIDICSSLNILQRQSDLMSSHLDVGSAINQQNMISSDPSSLTSIPSGELESYAPLGNVTSRLRRDPRAPDEDEEAWFENEEEEDEVEEEEEEDEEEDEEEEDDEVIDDGEEENIVRVHDLPKPKPRQNIITPPLVRQLSSGHHNQTTPIPMPRIRRDRINSIHFEPSIIKSASLLISEERRKRSLDTFLDEDHPQPDGNSYSSPNSFENNSAKDGQNNKKRHLNEPKNHSFASLVDYSDEEDDEPESAAIPLLVTSSTDAIQ